MRELSFQAAITNYDKEPLPVSLGVRDRDMVWSPYPYSSCAMRFAKIYFYDINN